jgi:branched-chain amino acid transport system ATP-binding protein
MTERSLLKVEPRKSKNTRRFSRLIWERKADVESLLRIEDIDVYYGPIQALEKVSLTVPKGTTVTILGGNGSGKSTTINTINGFLKPKKGSIEFNGKRINGLPPEKIVRMGVTQIPQGREIFPGLNVKENLELGAYIRNDRLAIKEDFEKVYAYFPKLKERKNQLAGTLSGGEQQMLAVGRGIMARPSLILMDEPSAGLAPALVNEIFNVIRSIRDEGNTILLVEQNVHMALAISEYGYILKNGRIVLEGSVESLLGLDEIKTSFLSGDEIEVEFKGRG